MKKLNIIFCTLAAVLIIACTTKQVGVKENWIDERDVIALASGSVSEWMARAGRPTLVEINGDTSIYYYNYRPTMYATTVYDSTKAIKTWVSVKEVKPTAENSTEIWGGRKNTMQIKVVKDVAISAVITAGPDKKTLIRDLNGELILDPASGYNPNISEEQRIDKNSEQFKAAYNKLHGRDPNASEYPPVVGTNMSPWEYYHYKQELSTQKQAEPTGTTTEQSTEQPAPAEPETPVATEPVVPQIEWH
jgi:hypothetical protein